jgi:hypothetical protein
VACQRTFKLPAPCWYSYRENPLIGWINKYLEGTLIQPAISKFLNYPSVSVYAMPLVNFFSNFQLNTWALRSPFAWILGLLAVSDTLLISLLFVSLHQILNHPLCLDHSNKWILASGILINLVFTNAYYELHRYPQWSNVCPERSQRKKALGLEHSMYLSWRKELVHRLQAQSVQAQNLPHLSTWSLISDSIDNFILKSFFGLCNCLRRRSSNHFWRLILTF